MGNFRILICTTNQNQISVVLVHRDIIAFWVSKALVLFHQRIIWINTEELAFLQYCEVTIPHDAISEALRCLSLKWGADDRKAYL